MVQTAGEERCKNSRNESCVMRKSEQSVGKVGMVALKGARWHLHTIHQRTEMDKGKTPKRETEPSCSVHKRKDVGTNFRNA